MDNVAKEAFLDGVAKAHAGDLAGATTSFTEAVDREPGLGPGPAQSRRRLVSGQELPGGARRLRPGPRRRPELGRCLPEPLGGPAPPATPPGPMPTSPRRPSSPRTIPSSCPHPRRLAAPRRQPGRGRRRLLADAGTEPRLSGRARQPRRGAHPARRLRRGASPTATTRCWRNPKNRDAAVNRATAHIMLNDFAGAAKDAETIFRGRSEWDRGVVRAGRGADGAGAVPPRAGRSRGGDQARRTLAAAWAARANAKYHLGDPGAAADYREAFRLDAASATRVTVRLLKAQARRRRPRCWPSARSSAPATATTRSRWPAAALTRLLQNRPVGREPRLQHLPQARAGDVKILDMLIAAVTKGKS